MSFYSIKDFLFVDKDSETCGKENLNKWDL